MLLDEGRRQRTPEALCASGFSNHTLRARLRRKGTLNIIFLLLLLVLLSYGLKKVLCKDSAWCEVGVPRETRCRLCCCMLQSVMLDESDISMPLLLVPTSAPLLSSCVGVISVILFFKG